MLLLAAAEAEAAADDDDDDVIVVVEVEVIVAICVMVQENRKCPPFRENTGGLEADRRSERKEIRRNFRPASLRAVHLGSQTIAMWVVGVSFLISRTRHLTLRGF